MKIASAEISMQSEHLSLSRSMRTETLNMWRGQRPATAGNLLNERPLPVRAPQVQLSMEALELQAAEAREQDTLDPKLKMLIAMVEAMTGKRVSFFEDSGLKQAQAQASAAGSAGGGAATAPADFGLEYDLHESYEEIEMTTVSASGVIRTADGKEISFQLDLSMSRHYYEENNVSIRAGNAQRKDPLVINFGGTAAELSDMRFRFDLDGDGSDEELAQFASASGYLALDRNGNGSIDSGKELFGPATNQGFSELAALDGDRNGWIDENDAVFNDLKVWVPGANGGSLISLKEAGIGALALAHVSSQFELRGQGNSDLGAVRETGLFLFEDGRVGSMQEIDLSV